MNNLKENRIVLAPFLRHADDGSIIILCVGKRQIGDDFVAQKIARTVGIAQKKKTILSDPDYILRNPFVVRGRLRHKIPVH